MCDDSIRAIDVDGDDQDSLFGSPSPPPSPRGRSPSVGLALPSSGSAGLFVNPAFSTSSTTQNVGTIALPGSHLNSELPVHPLALSLRSSEHDPRPPAPPELSARPGPRQVTPSQSGTSTPSGSRASSAARSTASKKNLKAKAKAATPVQRASLSSTPLATSQPQNYLRNQANLLGTAGLVGGLNPATISHRRTHGSTASNPIIVEEADATTLDPPRLGLPSTFNNPYLKPIDPKLLPAPTNKEIVDMLIGGKDIFPVLESILKLIAAGAGPPPVRHNAFSSPRRPPPPAPTSRTSQNRLTSASLGIPPLKRRKLNRVPAGAADWDVPYPFQQGEGPESYRLTWERERGKQLVSQLVGLIKSAASKVATKNYLKQEEEKRRLEEREQLWQQSLTQMLSGVGGAATASPPTSATISQGGKQQHTVKVLGHYRPATMVYGLEGREASKKEAEARQMFLDQLSRQQEHEAPTPSSESSASEPPSSIPPSVSQPSTYFGTSYDELLSSLLAASNPGGVDSNSSQTPDPSSADFEQFFAPSSDLGDAPLLDPGLFDTWMNILETFPSQPCDSSSNHASSSTQDSATPVAFDGLFDIPLDHFDFATHHLHSTEDENHGGDNSSIDPELMKISAPATNEGAPSLSVSPNPSTSSLGPMTPTTMGWDGSSNINSVYDEEMSGILSTLLDGIGSSDGEVRSHGKAMEQGKGREVVSLPTTQSEGARIRAARRADVLKRAGNRRQEIEEELISVRTQLWDATVDQAVLAKIIQN